MEEAAAAVSSVLEAEDHYACLGAPRDAPVAELKRRYRQMSVRVHPDKNCHPDATRAFQRLSSAWEVLGDEAARERYDQGASPSPSTTSSSSSSSSSSPSSPAPKAKAKAKAKPKAKPKGRPRQTAEQRAASTAAAKQKRLQRKAAAKAKGVRKAKAKVTRHMQRGSTTLLSTKGTGKHKGKGKGKESSSSSTAMRPERVPGDGQAHVIFHGWGAYAVGPEAERWLESPKGDDEDDVADDDEEDDFMNDEFDVGDGA